MPSSGRQPTINDVARVAGVPKKTVSRVINHSPMLKQDTHEKVESVIAKLGYVPNPPVRALALRRNFLLGLLHDNHNAQTALNFQEGVLDAIRDTEFALVVRPVDRHSPDGMRAIASSASPRHSWRTGSVCHRADRQPSQYFALAGQDVLR